MIQWAAEGNLRRIQLICDARCPECEGGGGGDAAGKARPAAIHADDPFTEAAPGLVAKMTWISVADKDGCAVTGEGNAPTVEVFMVAATAAKDGSVTVSKVPEDKSGKGIERAAAQDNATYSFDRQRVGPPSETASGGGLFLNKLYVYAGRGGGKKE